MKQSYEHSTYSALQFLLLIKTAPFLIKRIQTDNGTEFTKALISNDPNDKFLLEQASENMSIEYQRIKIATPRHNGKVERQHCMVLRSPNEIVADYLAVMF